MVQGYNIADNIVYQDNKITILLAKNGKVSSGKITKHVNIIYFFATDMINMRELIMEYFTSEDMKGVISPMPNMVSCSNIP